MYLNLLHSTCTICSITFTFPPLPHPTLLHIPALQGTGQLPKFEEDMFKLAEPLNGQPGYLVSTAEIPVTNLHREEILAGEDLPLKYASFTPHARANAGNSRFPSAYIDS